MNKLSTLTICVVLSFFYLISAEATDPKSKSHDGSPSQKSQPIREKEHWEYAQNLIELTTIGEDIVKNYKKLNINSGDVKAIIDQKISLEISQKGLEILKNITMASLLLEYHGLLFQLSISIIEPLRLKYFKLLAAKNIHAIIRIDAFNDMLLRSISESDSRGLVLFADKSRDVLNDSKSSIESALKTLSALIDYCESVEPKDRIKVTDSDESNTK
jgi:hypothetical protein